MKFEELTDRLQSGPGVPDSAVGCAQNDQNCISPDDSDGPSDPNIRKGYGINPNVLDDFVIDTLAKGIILHPKGDPNSSQKFTISGLLICFVTIIHVCM